MEESEVKSTGPVNIEDVRSALGDASPHQTNAAAIRQQLGRGSLSTIQRHLEALRRQHRAESAGVAEHEVEAPDAPKSLLTGLWEAAYGLALARVQDRLIRAQERIAEMESINQGQTEEIEALAEMVDKAEIDLDQARAEANAAREAQRKAEAERDDALRLHDQIAALMVMIQSMPKTPPAS
jgi:chromosome segregation ATPase